MLRAVPTKTRIQLPSARSPVSHDGGRQKDILLLALAIQFSIVGWAPLFVLGLLLTVNVVLNESIRRLDEYSNRR